jgi:hypothetical protein
MRLLTFTDGSAKQSVRIVSRGTSLYPTGHTVGQVGILSPHHFEVSFLGTWSSLENFGPLGLIRDSIADIVFQVLPGPLCRKLRFLLATVRQGGRGPYAGHPDEILLRLG